MKPLSHLTPLLVAATACVAPAESVDTGAAEQGISLPSDPKLDAKFYVKRISFMDFEGEYMDSAVVSSTLYQMATVSSDVKLFVEFEKGRDVPASVGGPAVTDSYVRPVDPKDPIAPGPSSPMYSPDTSTFYSIFNVTRPDDGNQDYTLEGWIEQGDMTYQVSPVTLSLKRTSAFAVMNKTFDEERCQTCHSLGDGAAWAAFHSKYGVGGLQPDVSNTTFCNQCHWVDDWRAPKFSMDIDWQQITTAAQRCVTVSINLPTSNQILDHFHKDPRLQWSYYSPYGCKNGPSISTPIMSPDVFLDAADKWAADGANCDGLAYPRQVAQW